MKFIPQIETLIYLCVLVVSLACYEDEVPRIHVSSLVKAASEKNIKRALSSCRPEVNTTVFTS